MKPPKPGQTIEIRYKQYYVLKIYRQNEYIGHNDWFDVDYIDLLRLDATGRPKGKVKTYPLANQAGIKEEVWLPLYKVIE